jgi:hypothetical protein
MLTFMLAMRECVQVEMPYTLTIAPHRTFPKAVLLNSLQSQNNRAVRLDCRGSLYVINSIHWQ